RATPVDLKRTRARYAAYEERPYGVPIHHIEHQNGIYELLAVSRCPAANGDYRCEGRRCKRRQVGSVFPCAELRTIVNGYRVTADSAIISRRTPTGRQPERQEKAP